MSIFIRDVSAVKPKSRLALFASLLAAAIFTGIVVAQLFTFEDFPAVLSSYPLPGGYLTGLLAASLLVTVEVLAVPSLVMMRLSPLMRLVSIGCGWATCLIWLVLGLLQFMARGSDVSNSGLLGATVAVPAGWLPMLFAAGLAMLLAVVSQESLQRVVRLRNYRLRFSRGAR